MRDVPEELEHADTLRFFANTISNSVCQVGQAQNVVPNSSWTHSELVDFAQKFPSYTFEIIQHGIIPPSVFEGIDIPVPQGTLDFWRRNKEAEIAARLSWWQKWKWW